MAILTGKTVALSWPGGLGASPDIDVVRWDATSRRQQEVEPNKSLTAILRLEQNPPPALCTATTGGNVPVQLTRAAVLVKITMITGLGVTLQRNVLLVGTVPKTVRLPAAQTISITAAIVSGSGAGGAGFFGNPYPPQNFGPGIAASASVTAVVTDHDVDFLGQDTPVWNPSGAVYNTWGNTPVAGPGQLLACQGVITSLGTASAVYLWLLDARDCYLFRFSVTAGGAGYTTPPTITYAVDAGGIDGGGSQFPLAVPNVTIAGGAVTGIHFPAGLTNNLYGPFGLGLLAAPLLTVTGGGGAGATATASVVVIRGPYTLPVIGPFTSAPQSFSFVDELKDACSFEGGLSFALSSDPYNFTPVTGASSHIDFKVAQ